MSRSYSRDVPTIHGTVVDEQGAPVEGVSISSRTAADVATSGADGAFVLHSKRIHTHALLWVDREGDFVAVDEPPRIAWGTRGARIVVKRPVPVEVRAIERGTTTPVARFRARIFQREERLSPYPRVERSCEADADGLATVVPVAQSGHVLVVHPGTPELESSEPILVDVRPGLHLTVELPRRVPFGVRVRLADGTPMAGSRMAIVRRGETPRDRHAPWHASVPEAEVERGRSWHEATIAGEATTGADGSAILHVAPGRCWLRVHGTGHVPRVLDVEVPPGGGSQVVEVERGATVEGLLLTPGVVERLCASESRSPVGPPREPTLMLCEPEAPHEPGVMAHPEPRHVPRVAPVVVGSDGSFTFRGVPAGDWRLVFYVDGQDELGCVGTQYELQPVLGLREGETRRLMVDLPGLMPAQVAGRILVNGEPLRGGQASFGRRIFRTDADGAFSVDLPPGDYRLMVYGRILADEVVHLHPGERLVRTFEIWHRVLRIRLLDVHGRSAGKRYVRFRNAPDPCPSSAWSDERGRVQIDPVCSGPIELAVWAPGVIGIELDKVGPVLEGVVLQVPFSQRVASFDVRLPPA